MTYCGILARWDRYLFKFLNFIKWLIKSKIIHRKNLGSNKRPILGKASVIFRDTSYLSLLRLSSLSTMGK